MITKFKIFDIINKIVKIFHSQKYKNILIEKELIKLSKGGCFVVALSIYDILKKYGAEIYAVVEYDKEERDYPVDHFIVGIDGIYFDSDGLYSIKNKKIIKYPNKKLWVGDMWYDENVINIMKKDISTVII
jgi:hypothetical protein